MLMLLVWELNFKSLVTEMHKKKKKEENLSVMVSV